MKAVQLVAHGAPGKFELRDLPEPQAGLDQVVVQVQSCGLNHLDLGLEEAGLPMPVSLPRTPGCEIAGQVCEIGSGVKDWRKGDSVAVQSNIFCGECEYCRRGEELFCLRAEMLGVTRDGGFAEKVLVPTRALMRLPSGVDFDVSAALSLAGSTAMHMLTFNLWPFFVKQQRLIGSYGRNRSDLEATLEWAAAGKLKPVIDSIFPLDQTPAAFAKLRSRNVLGKVIVAPHEPISETD